MVPQRRLFAATEVRKAPTHCSSRHSEQELIENDRLLLPTLRTMLALSVLIRRGMHQRLLPAPKSLVGERGRSKRHARATVFGWRRRYRQLRNSGYVRAQKSQLRTVRWCSLAEVEKIGLKTDAKPTAPRLVTYCNYVLSKAFVEDLANPISAILAHPFRSVKLEGSHPQGDCSN